MSAASLYYASVRVGKRVFDWDACCLVAYFSTILSLSDTGKNNSCRTNLHVTIQLDTVDSETANVLRLEIRETRF